ncbi:MAG TPA: DUF1223 domain-containing protein, partial [bacterium]|nr:DUF1223 domain-containing protein [bacterium]
AGFAVVELFTSEGCSSCPPADEALIRLSALAARERLPLFALEWHVDYWDYLGWKDPFGSRQATVRQETYARSLASSVFTPEAIVNGSLIANWAGDQAELERDVRSAAAQAPASGLDLQVQRGSAPSSLLVRAQTEGAPARSQVLVALVEEGLGARPTAGENTGQSLMHSSVVRSAVMLPAAGGQAELPIPTGTDMAHASVIGLVQDWTMRIDAAARADLSAAAGARVSGRVTDPQGRALAGITVQACSGAVCVPAVTDSTGAFHYDDLSPGTWSLVAGPNAPSVGITLAAGQDVLLHPPLVVSR